MVQIKEIHQPSGGDWGSCNIDKRIFQLFVKMFGEVFFEILREEDPEPMLEIEDKMEWNLTLFAKCIDLAPSLSCTQSKKSDPNRKNETWHWWESKSVASRKNEFWLCVTGLKKYKINLGKWVWQIDDVFLVIYDSKKD